MDPYPMKRYESRLFKQIHVFLEARHQPGKDCPRLPQPVQAKRPPDDVPSSVLRAPPAASARTPDILSDQTTTNPIPHSPARRYNSQNPRSEDRGQSRSCRGDIDEIRRLSKTSTVDPFPSRVSRQNRNEPFRSQARHQRHNIPNKGLPPRTRSTPGAGSEHHRRPRRFRVPKNAHFSFAVAATLSMPNIGSPKKFSSSSCAWPSQQV
jgi:hypothetical protein